MKSFLVTLFAALLLTSGAHATPKSKPAKASFVCTLTDLQQWGAPDEDDVDIVIVVRLSCRNTGTKTVRIKVADVTLLNTEEQKYSPDHDRDAFDTIYESEDPGPTFVDRFVDIAKGETKDIGFTFTGGNGLTDPHLTLDINGTQYKHSRERVEEYNVE
jgi:hypothetical protein